MQGPFDWNPIGPEYFGSMRFAQGTNSNRRALNMMIGILISVQVPESSAEKELQFPIRIC